MPISRDSSRFLTHWNLYDFLKWISAPGENRVGKGKTFLRPALDVAYFLAGNLDAKVARAIESDLVRAYHDQLLARGVNDYPFAECWRDHQLSKLFLLQHSFDRLCALLPEGDPDGLLLAQECAALGEAF